MKDSNNTAAKTMNGDDKEQKDSPPTSDASLPSGDEELAEATTSQDGENRERQDKDDMPSKPNRPWRVALVVSLVVAALAVGVVIGRFVGSNSNSNSNNDVPASKAQAANETMTNTTTTKFVDAASYLAEALAVDLPSFLPNHNNGASAGQELPTETYKNREDLIYDAEQLGRYLVGNEIFDNLHSNHHGYCRRRGAIYEESGNPELYCEWTPHWGDYRGPFGGYGTHLDFSPSHTDYESPNLERHDIVKKYGNYLYVVAKGANEISILRVGNPNTTEVGKAFVPPFSQPWRVTCKYQDNGIQGLVLHEDLLIVLVSGRCQANVHNKPEKGALLVEGTSIYRHRIDADSGEPMFEDSEIVHGAFRDAYFDASEDSGRGVLRVVTQSIINKWGLLLEPIVPGPGETLESEAQKEDYVRASVDWSLYQTIPAFAELLAEDLATFGLLEGLGRFWIPGNSTVGSHAPWQPDWQPFRGEYAGRIISVHTMDIVGSQPNPAAATARSSSQAPPGAPPFLAGRSYWPRSTSSTLVMGYHTNIYTSARAIVVADEMHLAPGETHTLLSVFRPRGPSKDWAGWDHASTGPSTKWTGVAAVPGTLLDAYSLDTASDSRKRPHTDYLRLATTPTDGNRDKDDDPFEDYWIGNFHDYAMEVNVGPRVDVHVLRLFREGSYYDDSGPERIGSIELETYNEEEDERYPYKSVRFLDNLAYVVDFESDFPVYYLDTSDPLYIIDLDKPEDPRILGNSTTPGFAGYLQPIYGDGSDDASILLLGVGPDGDNDFDDDNQFSRTQLSIWNTSADSGLPSLADRLLFEDWTWIWKDPRAFRYHKDISTTGGRDLLAVPVGLRPYPYGTDDARVFVVSVYGDVDDKKLAVETIIDHGLTMRNVSNWKCDGMPARTVFFGDSVGSDSEMVLVTIMGTKIIATNLATKEQTIVVGDERFCP